MCALSKLFRCKKESSCIWLSDLRKRNTWVGLVGTFFLVDTFNWKERDAHAHGPPLTGRRSKSVGLFDCYQDLATIDCVLTGKARFLPVPIQISGPFCGFSRFRLRFFVLQLLEPRLILPPITFPPISLTTVCIYRRERQAFL